MADMVDYEKWIKERNGRAAGISRGVREISTALNAYCADFTQMQDELSGQQAFRITEGDRSVTLEAPSGKKLEIGFDENGRPFSAIDGDDRRVYDSLTARGRGQDPVFNGSATGSQTENLRDIVNRFIGGVIAT